MLIFEHEHFGLVALLLHHPELVVVAVLILEAVYWLGLVAAQILELDFILVAAVDLMRHPELEVHLAVVVISQFELVLVVFLRQLQIDHLLFVRVVSFADVISQYQLVLLRVLPLVAERVPELGLELGLVAE